MKYSILNFLLFIFSLGLHAEWPHQKRIAEIQKIIAESRLSHAIDRDSVASLYRELFELEDKNPLYENIPDYVSKIIPSDKFSWLDQDMMTSVKNQENETTCWAFATMGSYEAAIKIKYSEDLDLSEAISATRFKYFNETFDFMEDFGGVILESDAPYNISSREVDTLHRLCYPTKKVYRIGQDIQIIKQAILEFGPMYTDMDEGEYLNTYPKDNVFEGVLLDVGESGGYMHAVRLGVELLVGQSLYTVAV